MIPSGTTAVNSLSPFLQLRPTCLLGAWICACLIPLNGAILTLTVPQRGQSFPLSDRDNGNSKIRSESDRTFDTSASLELGIAGISKSSDEGSKEKNGTLWLPNKD